MSRTAVVALLAFVLSLSACASGSDDKPPVAANVGVPEPAAKPVSAENERWFRSTAPASGMRLMSGDNVAISVQGQESLSVKRDVPPNGEIPVYQTDRTVNALGKTTQELEAEIASAYAAKIEKPYVTVFVAREAPRSIYVVGAVERPGDFSVSGNERMTVAQALARAGGWKQQSDLSSVTIQRIYPPTGQTVVSPPLDIRRVIDLADQRDNLMVLPGDTIVVPDMQESRVQVLGNVVKQGSVPWYRGMKLSRAITESGGFMRFAKKKGIKVIRQGSGAIIVNYEDVIDGKAPDLELEPRDVVFVDERWI